MKYRRMGSFFVLFVVLSLACNLPVNLYSPENSAEKETPEEVRLPDETEAFSNNNPPEPGDACGYMWASQPLPELSDELQSMFDEAGMEEIRILAEAFGEKCIHPDGSEGQFLTMQTDLRFSIRVESTRDSEEMARQVKEILRILSGIAADDFPGPIRGYIGISFEDGSGEQLNLWFNDESAQNALNQGLEGAAFLEALNLR